MALRKKLKCPNCTRRFSMPGHLARHVSAIHNGNRRPRNGRSRNASRGSIRRMPRANLAYSRLSLEQLRDVIDAARTEARRRLKELQATIQ